MFLSGFTSQLAVLRGPRQPFRGVCESFQDPLARGPGSWDKLGGRELRSSVFSQAKKVRNRGQWWGGLCVGPLGSREMPSPCDFLQDWAILSRTGILPQNLGRGEGPPQRNCFPSKNVPPVHASVLKAGLECYMWNCVGARGKGTARLFEGLCTKQHNHGGAHPWRRTVCPLNCGHLTPLGQGSLLKAGSEGET